MKKTCLLFAVAALLLGTLTGCFRSVDELFTHPRHPYTMGLIDSRPSPDYQGDRLRMIPGSVPTLKDMPEGCPFNNRCQYATGACGETFPDFACASEGHTVACHHWKTTPENG